MNVSACDACGNNTEVRGYHATLAPGPDGLKPRIDAVLQMCDPCRLYLSTEVLRAVIAGYVGFGRKMEKRA